MLHGVSGKHHRPAYTRTSVRTRATKRALTDLLLLHGLAAASSDRVSVAQTGHAPIDGAADERRGHHDPEGNCHAALIGLAGSTLESAEPVPASADTEISSRGAAPANAL